MVAKDKATINLLEVGDNAKKKYLNQSSKTSISFLIQSIEKANQCELNYKISKNQRLLVELTLMQIASITFDGEKKKPANYIIPATFFTSISPPLKKEIIPDVKVKDNLKTPSKVVDKEPLASSTQISKPPILKNIKRRSNSLSLKSIHQQKDIKKTTTEINYDDYPRKPFTESELQTAWKDFQKFLIKKGEKSIASILATDIPTLQENFHIQFILPNKLMEDQLKQVKPKLIKFIRESLNNYGISLNIVVNETIEKKFAYTAQEKYNKLLEKNAFLKDLKDTFQLDL